MKINLKRWLGLAASSTLLLAALNSCVKNRNDLAVDFTQIQATVELLQNSALSATPATYKGLVFVASPTPSTEIMYVNLAFPDPAPNDITVTLAIDPTAIADYNTAHPGSNFQILAPNTYSFPTTVTIKKGQRFA